MADNDDVSAANRNAQITYKPTISGFYLIAAQGSTTNELGNYTLIIQ